MDLTLEAPEFFSPNKRVLRVSMTNNEGTFIASKISEDGQSVYITIDRIGSDYRRIPEPPSVSDTQNDRFSNWCTGCHGCSECKPL